MNIQCAVCHKSVDRVESIWDKRNRCFDIVVYCHGEQRRYSTDQSFLANWRNAPLEAMEAFEQLQPPINQIKPLVIDQK